MRQAHDIPSHLRILALVTYGKPHHPIGCTQEWNQPVSRMAGMSPRDGDEESVAPTIAPQAVGRNRRDDGAHLRRSS
jgi:hypothetical protein